MSSRKFYMRVLNFYMGAPDFYMRTAMFYKRAPHFDLWNKKLSERKEKNYGRG